MAVPVSIEHVTKTFGTTRAVDDVSLDIAAGELFFLLGPSGCGKTTLLRCIAGFAIPDAGRLAIGDEDITRVPPHRRDTGMVFQSYALWPHLTVAENVAFGLKERRIPAAEVETRVQEALAKVQMTDRARHKPAQLSGGQQQRVALARALVIRPRCLLLDEPLSNLDAKLRLDMRGEIRRLCKEAGLTAIYVTHDQKEALSIADRMAVMKDGRLIQAGTPRELYRHPASRFVAGFLGETNLYPAQVRSLRDGSAALDSPLGEVTSRSLPAGADLRPGQAVHLSIRPEALRLGGPPADAPNILSATVHDSVYLGESAQHRLTLHPSGGADTEARALEVNPRFAPRESETEQATVWFEPEDAVVLED